LFLLAVFSWGVYLVYRSLKTETGQGCWYRLIAFGIFWFFVALSVESSIIPIADVIYEHRLYLPSVGFFMAFMCVVMWIRERYGSKTPIIWKALPLFLIIVVVVLSATAYARNTVWRSEVTLWEDVIKKSPAKPRPLYNYRDSLGRVYLKEHRFQDALGEFQAAISINPGIADAHKSLGLAYMHTGRFGEALKAVETALSIEPHSAYIHDSLGQVYAAQGKVEEAGKAFRMALELDPTYVDARRNLDLLNKQLSERR
jgi:tetratricopeptide (TPR) repeat protein